ncbi:phage tail protein [Vallitalea okinawensis]|uniref:phage tail protein n=1 Tax=Vallitalea okinawensis TaxID=2078660 RepID=UPI000CFB48E4|nr:phage tail protein [Vallitalea okinawensis]
MSEYIPFNLIESYKKEDPIQLDITLCKPDYNRTPLQVLSTAYKKELSKRFGSVDEMKFQVPRTIDGTANEDYDLIKGDLVLLVEFDGQKQYFIVTECAESVDKKVIHKNVVAYSYEFIFSNKLIRGWNEGQQPLSYIMNYVISLFPSWQLGITEPDLMTIERTMDVAEQTVLEFLIDIQKKYLCIFEFDTINRTIDIRKLENIGKNKGFVISERNYARSIDITPNFQEVVTRLRCYGKDNLSINGLNPTGQPYLETYEYFQDGFKRVSDGSEGWQIIGHSDYMSDGLCMALLDYQVVINNNSSTLSTKIDELATLQEELDRLLYASESSDKGLEVLKTELNGIQLQIDALIRSGASDLSSLKSKETELLNKINTKQTQVDNQQALVEAKDKEILDLKELMKVENNLTEDQIKELDMFTREKTWSDSAYVDVNDLYEEGQKLLLKMAQPAIQFSVDVINFLKCLDRSEDWEYVTTGLGDVITIESDNLNASFEARLVEYTFSETSNTLTMNFSNKGSFDDPSVYLKDLLKESISTSTTLSMEKTKYGKYSEERTEFIDFIEGRLDLSKKRAFAGVDQEVVIDERGILLTDTSDIDRQVKLIGDLIAFTNDGWNTSGTAISSEGVVGEAIYGKVLAGANLTIENTSGTFEVDQNGVTIHGANLTITNGLPTSELSGENLLMDNASYNGVKINSTDGITVRTNDADITGTIKTSLNASEGIKIQYHNGSGWLDRFKVDSSTGDLIAHNMQLKGGQVINSSGKAVIDLDNGVLNWDELTIDGKIKATEIEDLVVGDNVTMGANATISWNKITSKPSINNYSDSDAINAIESTYIDGSSVWTIDVYAQNIQGNYITGKTVRTSSSGKRIEMTSGNDIEFYSETGNLAGMIDYDIGGAGTEEEEAKRIFLRTNSGYALKLESAEGLSIESKSGSIWLQAPTGTAYINGSKILTTASGSGVKGGSSTFVGNGGERTIAHGLGSSPTAVSAMPKANPNGYLGEVWIRYDSTNIYVGNTGSYTGALVWMAS